MPMAPSNQEEVIPYLERNKKVTKAVLRLLEECDDAIADISVGLKIEAPAAAALVVDFLCRELHAYYPTGDLAKSTSGVK